MLVVSEAAVWQALARVMDPEIPYSIVDLGLVYGVWVDGDRVRVQVTLTTRGCPLVQRISEDVRRSVQTTAGADGVEVEIVWDPPWSPAMATEVVRQRLGWQ
jgi:metal-sulfur cluster biosynthetic enzyme